jgi:hypothetical protein
MPTAQGSRAESLSLAAAVVPSGAVVWLCKALAPSIAPAQALRLGSPAPPPKFRIFPPHPPVSESPYCWAAAAPCCSMGGGPELDAGVAGLGRARRRRQPPPLPRPPPAPTWMLAIPRSVGQRRPAAGRRCVSSSGGPGPYGAVAALRLLSFLSRLMLQASAPARHGSRARCHPPFNIHGELK